MTKMSEIKAVNDLEKMTDEEFEAAFSTATEQDVDRLSYGIKFMEPSTDYRRWIGRKARLLSLLNPPAPRVVEPVEMVRCSCGHTVPRIQVMSTSFGTSCPDCYDRMSEEG
jgi:hypothetical protein